MFERENIMLKKIIKNVESVIVGKRGVIELVVTALISNGHILLEDVPGVGKTRLIAAVARSIDGSFKRIQFTADVLPSDVTGFSVYNQKTGDFEFKNGAIMSQFVLADEINRTSPKTQAALLEAMEEKQVSVDGVTYKMPQPFMVMATQNPIEFMGTFPLPEAQLDRFLIKISVGYPDAESERSVLSMHQMDDPFETLQAVATPEDIINIQNEVKKVFVHENLEKYIVSIVSATRNHPSVRLGASPRASLALYRTAQATAYINGRDFVIPDDIQKMVIPVMAHRIILSQETKFSNTTADDVLNEIKKSVPVPSGK
ncbi:MAG: MoxR family ATPase [Clostridia bacterium]|nr:MoxR family ATPase [Clostridia bacterium]